MASDREVISWRSLGSWVATTRNSDRLSPMFTCTGWISPPRHAEQLLPRNLDCSLLKIRRSTHGAGLGHHGSAPGHAGEAAGHNGLALDGGAAEHAGVGRCDRLGGGVHAAGLHGDAHERPSCLSAGAPGSGLTRGATAGLDATAPEATFLANAVAILEGKCPIVPPET